MTQSPYDPKLLQGTLDVDLVLCIDATESMGPFFQLTKRRALSLPADILAEARTQGKRVGSLRVKVIAFRDYRSDREYAMQLTDFFDYFKEKAELSSLMADICAAGGGADEAEDALEALAYAMASDWKPSRPGVERRQIIALWTDAAAHSLGEGKTSPYYDPTLPKSFGELTARWMNDGRLDRDAKRLVLFAPRVRPWTVLESNWDNVTLYPSTAGRELTEADYCGMVYSLVKKTEAGERMNRK